MSTATAFKNMTMWDVFKRIEKFSMTGRVGAALGPLGLRFFEISQCEVCGCDCEGVEGSGWMTVHGWKHADYVEAGAPYFVDLPEYGACEALGGIAVCPDCYQDEE